MVLLVLKCHMALWRKWHKLHYMKGEFLYQLFIIMSINLQGGDSLLSRLEIFWSE